MQIFHNLCNNEQIIQILVDSLILEDPDLIDAIICSLARMIQMGVSDTTQDKIRKEFEKSGGNEIIEKLIDHENVDISERAIAFRNLVLNPPEPYQFQ